MSQDNLIILKCEECASKNYYTFKNKKKLREHKLKMKKHCKPCRKHTLHIETKKK